MAVLKGQILSNVYYDSLMLMKLQSDLLKLPGVVDAAALLGTKANKEMLTEENFAFDGFLKASSEDLIIAVRAQDDKAAQDALDQVGKILSGGGSSPAEQIHKPKSLSMAVRQLPEARWVLISVPGQYAADLANEAIRYDKNVFLFSDNVTIAQEIELKQMAANKGLLLLGPDCGTAWINGVGFGFANVVQKGPIGLIAASGTGLQYVGVRIHQHGSGISHGLGIGGRDASEDVSGIMAHQCLDLLARDEDTKVIVLIFKPPSPKVADELLKAARSVGKPVIVDFLGYSGRSSGNLYFVETLDEAADLSIKLANGIIGNFIPHEVASFAKSQKYLRGLFSGGTLAYEVLSILVPQLPEIYSNVRFGDVPELPDNVVSRCHTILDLGDDVFTVGRPHPMIDNSLRIKRMFQEAEDPQTAIIFLDVVLGHGSHPDPASELAPAVAQVIVRAKEAGRVIDVIVLVVGTDNDPQNLSAQVEAFTKAGAHVFTSTFTAVAQVLYTLNTIEPLQQKAAVLVGEPIDLCEVRNSSHAINVGLPLFMDSLVEQNVETLQVDWKPPAGGDEKLTDLLKILNRE